MPKQSSDVISLNLPYPPSVNHYWRYVGPGRAMISRAGKTFREQVILYLRQRDPVVETLQGDIGINVLMLPPDRRRRDIDNILKPLLDALEHGDVYEDDSQIVKLTIEKSREPYEQGLVIVDLWPIVNEDE